MSTPAGHSSRHAWQWTHRSATALNSSLVRRLRSKLPGQHAADQVGLRPRRGLLGRQRSGRSGTSAARPPACGSRRSGCRRATASTTWAGSQFNCSSTRFAQRRRRLVGRRRRGRCGRRRRARSRQRRTQVRASAGRGSSPTILPGLRMFSGSKIRFTSRNTSYSGPACWRTNGVRLSPQACSPLIVPPTANTSW